jgi:hypothetical protein
MSRDTRLTRRRFAAGAIAIGTGACAGGGLEEKKPAVPVAAAPPMEAGPSPAQPDRAEAGAPLDLTADPDLALNPVLDGAAPPLVVWSWTTTEQAAELRKNRVLFTRTRSPTLGRGLLFDVLTQRSKKGDPVAARLAGPALAKGRFGWHTPWPTILGAASGETYGLELLRIELRRDSWFARVRTSKEEISFVDLSGAPVPTAKALASFDRVAGIMFENDVQANWACPRTRGTGSGECGLIYREVYLGNDQRIASWSHRTAAILGVLEGHAAELTRLRDWLAVGGGGDPGYWDARTAQTWRGGAATTTLDRYLGSLAFVYVQYTPDAAHIGAIVDKLREARFTPDPLVHAPARMP